jgi:hypothetical protein
LLATGTYENITRSEELSASLRELLHEYVVPPPPAGDLRLRRRIAGVVDDIAVGEAVLDDLRLRFKDAVWYAGFSANYEELGLSASTVGLPSGTRSWGPIDGSTVSRSTLSRP